jgi:hypothetical protein
VTLAAFKKMPETSLWSVPAVMVNSAWKIRFVPVYLCRKLKSSVPQYSLNDASIYAVSTAAICGRNSSRTVPPFTQLSAPAGMPDTCKVSALTAIYNMLPCWMPIRLPSNYRIANSFL